MAGSSIRYTARAPEFRSTYELFFGRFFCTRPPPGVAAAEHSAGFCAQPHHHFGLAVRHRAGAAGVMLWFTAGLGWSGFFSIIIRPRVLGDLRRQRLHRFDCQPGQRRLRPACRLGAHPLPLPRPPHRRRAGGPAFRLAHRGRRHCASPRSTPRMAGSARCSTPLRPPDRVFAVRHRGRDDVRLAALHRPHRAAGHRGSGG